MSTSRRITIGLYILFALLVMGCMVPSLQPAMRLLWPVLFLMLGVSAFLLTFHPSAKSLLAGVMVLFMIFIAEACGITVGFPFGDYVYTDLLGPKIWDVPLVVPFLWLSILIPAWAAADRFLKFKHVVVASIVVTAFDGVLEFAADSLDLWHWKDGLPSELNYISWFGLSYVAFSILRKYGTERPSNPIVPHFLVAQLLLFALTDLGRRYLFTF